jgi:hypothetical protein
MGAANSRQVLPEYPERDLLVWQRGKLGELIAFSGSQIRPAHSVVSRERLLFLAPMILTRSSSLASG